MHLLNWLRKLKRSRRESPSGVESNSGSILFEGGNGDTVETAIVVRGASFDLVGTYAEFGWLTQTYGQKDSDWKLMSHSHGKYGDREIDTFELQLANGTPLTVFFDCTESFGKPLPADTESGEPGGRHRLDDTVAPGAV
jgi:hypothetical protein